MLTYIDNFFYSANLPICKADFDAVRVVGRTGENIFDDAFGQFACTLILFEDDHHRGAGFYL